MSFENELRYIGVKYNIDSIGIFGSRARGDFREDSDYDIFIIGEISLSDELKLEEEISDILKQDVDVIKLDKDTDRILAKNIINEAHVIYSKNNSFEKFFKEIENFFIENSDFIYLRKRDLFY